MHAISHLELFTELIQTSRAYRPSLPTPWTASKGCTGLLLPEGLAELLTQVCSKDISMSFPRMNRSTRRQTSLTIQY